MGRKQACDSCHKKKIQCDRTKPRCEWCVHRNIPCDYTRFPGRGNPKSKGSAESVVAEDGDSNSIGLEREIDRRIGRLEQLLGHQLVRGTERELGRQSGSNQNNIQSTASISLASVGGPPFGNYIEFSRDETINLNHTGQISSVMSYGTLQFAGYHLGEISSQWGTPVFSDDGIAWIRQRTGVANPFASVYQTVPFDKAEHASKDSLQASSTEFVDLPPRQIVESYLSTFQSSFLRFIFPVVDAILFSQMIVRAYQSIDNLQSSTSSRADRVCIFAFVALVSFILPDRIASAHFDAEAYAREAQCSLLLALSTPTLEGLQAALMLCIYYDFSGDLSFASMFQSLSSQCLFKLKGHLGHHNACQPGQVHLRKLFWLCYFFDKHIALRSGQPPTMEDRHCELTLEHDVGLLSKGSEMGPSLDEARRLDFFPSDLKLTIIKSRVLTKLYSLKSMKKSDTQLLCDVRKLDDELEEWRLAIPEYIRPGLRIPALLPDLIHPELFTLVMFVHFEYLYMISTIHYACGRCAAWSHDNDKPRAIESSLELSVEASRSTILYFKDVSARLHRASFWLVIFYPLWATLIVFCNVIHSPGIDQALGDIDLLRSIPEHISGLIAKGLTKGDLTNKEELHLDRLYSFTTELVNLAEISRQRILGGFIS